MTATRPPIGLILLIATTVSSSSFAEVKPIHHWVFEAARLQGRTLQALAGPDGKIQGRPTAAPDLPIGAIQLDGRRDSILITAHSGEANLPTRRITAEAWVRIDQPLTWGGIIGAVHDDGSDESGWILGYVGHQFTFALATQDKPSLTYLTASKPYRLGAWYHVVGTYDGKQHRLYVNGALQAQQNDRHGPILYPQENTFYEIGAYHDDNEFYHLTGMIHEVAVYNRALTPKQILNHYNAKKDQFPEKPVEIPPQYPEIGPYARYNSPTSVTISWHTAAPSPTTLQFGTLNDMKQTPGDGRLRQDHHVTINTLETGRHYQFQIALVQDSQPVRARIHTLDTSFNYTIQPVPDERSPYGEEPAAAANAKKILEASNVDKGYALMIGCDDQGQLAYELARQSELVVTCIDTNSRNIAASRKKLYEAGVYGDRITARHVSSYNHLPFTRYFANLIVVANLHADPKEAYRVLRPSGGVLIAGQFTPSSRDVNHAQLDKWMKNSGADSIRFQNHAFLSAMTRRPALPGVGVWTHEYGLPDNAANSRDELGGARGTDQFVVQWLGRPGADAMTDRNPRKPAPLAVNGRIFTQGLKRIIAQDAYNGAILWTLEIPDLQRVNMPRDAGNWCADPDFVYAAVRDRCWKINAATGEIDSTFPVIKNNREQKYDWGYIARSDGLLFGSGVRQGSTFTNIFGGSNEGWADATSGLATFKVCSDLLFAANPTTGQQIWQREKGVIINSSIAIGDGQIYFAECRNPDILSKPERRIGSDNLWKNLYLVALDVKTGHPLWETPLYYITPGTVVFYLEHSADRVVILSSHKKYHLYAYDAHDGKPVWKAQHPWPRDNHGGHMQHPAIVGGIVYARPIGYQLETGRPIVKNVPLGGCGTLSGAAGTLIFRDSNINMWDVVTGRQTDWARLRPGCWLSTVAADGLVLSPEGGGGCSCAGWFETSLGFIARDDANN